MRHYWSTVFPRFKANGFYGAFTIVITPQRNIGAEYLKITQQRFHARNAERLHQVAVTLIMKGLTYRIVVAHGGGHDNFRAPTILQTRSPFECSDGSQRLFAIHDWHHDVEKNNIVEIAIAE